MFSVKYKCWKNISRVNYWSICQTIDRTIFCGTISVRGVVRSLKQAGKMKLLKLWSVFALVFLLSSNKVFAEEEDDFEDDGEEYLFNWQLFLTLFQSKYLRLLRSLSLSLLNRGSHYTWSTIYCCPENIHKTHSLTLKRTFQSNSYIESL